MYGIACAMNIVVSSRMTGISPFLACHMEWVVAISGQCGFKRVNIQ